MHHDDDDDKQWEKGISNLMLWDFWPDFSLRIKQFTSMLQ
jgi:hypothetical protein